MMYAQIGERLGLDIYSVKREFYTDILKRKRTKTRGRFSSNGLRIKIKNTNWFGRILNEMRKVGLSPASASSYQDVRDFFREIEIRSAEMGKQEEDESPSYGGLFKYPMS